MVFSTPDCLGNGIIVAILVQLAHKSIFNILCFSVSFDFDEPCWLGPRIQKIRELTPKISVITIPSCAAPVVLRGRTFNNPLAVGPYLDGPKFSPEHKDHCE